MCLRGLGARTKDGAVLITAATSGGAIIPPIMSAVTTARGVRYSYCIVVAVFAFGAVLPIYTTLVRPAKHQVDPYDKPSVGSPSTTPGRFRGLRFHVPRRASKQAVPPSQSSSSAETPDMNDDKWPTMLS